MNRAVSVLTSIVALAALFLATIPASSGRAQESDATPAGTPMGQKGMDMGGTGAAYMVIRNSGAEVDRLVGGETDIAKVVEIHEVIDVEGVMEMHPLADGLEIPAGGEVTLQPGGSHVMLIGLKEDLVNGKTYELTLHFARVGDVTVPVDVRPRAELAADATPQPAVVAGEITIEGAWSRPAPALGAAQMAMGTPEATPSS